MSLAREHFTGIVAAKTLCDPSRELPMAVYAVTFVAGAHTHWHTHPRGQGLYVTDGVALVQIEGQPPVRLRPGESIWIDAAKRHWHGAGPETSMTHVAYQQAAEDLTTADWHEPVTVATYDYAAKENH